MCGAEMSAVSKKAKAQTDNHRLRFSGTDVEHSFRLEEESFFMGMMYKK